MTSENEQLEISNPSSSKIKFFLQKKRKILLPLSVLLLLLLALLALRLFVRNEVSDSGSLSGDAGKKKIITGSQLYNNPEDKDFDGLNSEEEKKLGTSDLSVDSDRDGISDPDEVNIWHTDPKKIDTDGDGFVDGYEIINGYDPKAKGKKL